MRNLRLFERQRGIGIEIWLSDELDISRQEGFCTYEEGCSRWA